MKPCVIFSASFSEEVATSLTLSYLKHLKKTVNVTLEKHAP